ncbi:MAG: fimbria/pilus outer membrane usher protein [Xanthobacteraceae bacterium]
MGSRRYNWKLGLAQALIVAVSFFSATATRAATDEGIPLQLDVTINGTKSGLLGAFQQLPDGRLAAKRQELADLGVKVSSADDIVILDSALPGKFKYDAQLQSIAFDLTDDNRVAKAFNALGETTGSIPVQSGWGTVLNYTLFGSETSGSDKRIMTFNGASATLDARAFSPYGTLSQTGILGTTTTRDMTALRLDTTYTYSDPESLITYRAGDAITGGLTWTRPIRFGGVQMQRNFGLRSDLVTAPLPSFSGSAAVPSTLDVYVNNTKTYTQEVPPGPFQVNNLPLISGGEARLVLRDASGREVQTSLPFYTSPRLLRTGLTDFSMEAGVPRIGYASNNDSYVDRAFGAVSARHGFSDWLTLEGHAEGASDLYNGGVGALIRTGEFGILSVAASGSAAGGALGMQGYAAFETKVYGITVNASSMRTFGNYNDLASVTAPLPTFLSGINPVTGLTPTTISPPKAVDRISFGTRLPDFSNLGIAFVHLEPSLGDASNIFSVSWSKQVFSKAQLFVSSFADVKQHNNYGVFAGVSFPLGDDATMSTGATTSKNGTSVTTDASKPLRQEIGSYGWRVRDSEGAVGYRSAAGSYRGSAGKVEAGVEQSNGAVRTIGQAEGSIATIGTNVFFANKIDDSFAVVDTGVPGVAVSYENRPIGETDANGRLLLPNLRAYGRNRISIDPKNLPVNSEIEQVDDVVSPAYRSGVLVKFTAKTDVKAAVVVLTGSDGKPLAAGSSGRLDGTRGEFVVGYDGRAYIKDLSETNNVTITTGTGECRAAFDYSPVKDNQVVVGPVACR